MLDAIKMYFIPCLISGITYIYLYKKITESKINFKIDINFYLLLVLLIFLSNVFLENSIKFIINIFLIILLTKVIYKKQIYYLFSVSILLQLIVFISELIYSTLMISILGEISNFFYQTNYFFISNLAICCISIIIINLHFVSNKIKNILCYTERIDKFTKYIILLILVTIINFLLLFIYNDFNNKYYPFLNFILIVFYVTICYMLLKEKTRNIVYREENEILLSNLNEYEKMLDYQRINNHENKNQLLVVKSMIEKKNKKTLEYINEIIKEKREDNEVIYTKAKRIPSGGLQGLIYQKMLLMQENNIEVILDVSTQVRKIDLTNISSKMNYDICRIVGIILDNAIEETCKFNKKDREIIISMYVDEFFFIEVSNRIKDNFDINKISEKGYTTKTKGHGYGLSLLTKIVNENNNIYNEIRIVNNIFTQIVKIKM